MLVITTDQIRKFVEFEDIIDAIEDAFRAEGDGRSAVFPVARGTGSDPTHIVAVKSGRDGSTNLIGVKVASYVPSNRARGLASHTSTTLLIDDETADVLAVVEAGYLNGMRTAAANAVAVRALARPEAAVLSVIGLGAQAVFEAGAVCLVRPIEKIYAASRSASSNEQFCKAVQARTGLPVAIVDAEEAVRRAEILVTVTPSTEPLFEADWVQPGTHISAMGADNVGKMELPVELVARSTLVMDLPAQAIVLGEAQHVARLGLVARDDMLERSLGALLCGRIPGRRSADDITVFDSSGIAVQDVAAACIALRAVCLAQNLPLPGRLRGRN